MGLMGGRGQHACLSPSVSDKMSHSKSFPKPWQVVSASMNDNHLWGSARVINSGKRDGRDSSTWNSRAWGMQGGLCMQTVDNSLVAARRTGKMVGGPKVAVGEGRGHTNLWCSRNGVGRT